MTTERAVPTRITESGEVVPHAGTPFRWETAVATDEPHRGDYSQIPWYPVSLAGVGQTSLGRQVPVVFWRRAVPVEPAPGLVTR